MVKGGDSYYGLLQAFADALKLLLKEYVAPTQANFILFFLGPVLWGRIPLFIIWDKLSNYGDTLKLLVPSSIWKYVCGWINNLCTVISQKIFERKMGNRVAKSEWFSVKVQRFYDSWCKIMVLFSHLRYILMGLERDYRVKVLSNLIKFFRPYSTYSSCFPQPKIKLRSRSFSTLKSPLLDPNFVTGFIDAEGSWVISIQKEPKNKTGWTIKSRLSISLHKKDIAILEQIKIYFKGVGNISKEGKNVVQYRVASLRDLINIVIPHFDKYPLITKKKADFILFKQVVELMNRKEHLTREGLIKVLSIKESINLGLSDSVKSAFLGIVAVERPIISNQKILDPYWLAGFASGEGCFLVTLIKTTSNQLGYWVQLSFQLTQHTRDIELINNLKEYLDCGQTTVYDNHNFIKYVVSNISDIMEKVLPFFDKYSIVGVKSQDYEDFKQVVLMVKDRKHLTFEGLNLIKNIKEGMNKLRKY